MIELMNVGFFQIQDQHKFNNWDNDFMDYHRESMMSHQMCHSGSGPENGKRGEGCALGVDRKVGVELSELT